MKIRDEQNPNTWNSTEKNYVSWVTKNCMYIVLPINMSLSNETNFKTRLDFSTFSMQYFASKNLISQDNFSLLGSSSRPGWTEKDTKNVQFLMDN